MGTKGTEFDQLVRVMEREVDKSRIQPWDIESAARRMRRAGLAYRRILTRECSDAMLDVGWAALEKRRLLGLAMEAAQSVGLTLVEGSGDCRGYSFFLKLPSGHSNSMGGSDDGWGVG